MVESEKRLLLHMISLYMGGLSLTAVADRINAEGYRTRRGMATMRDHRTLEMKPWYSCCEPGCSDIGTHRRRGLRYCARHYRALVEDDWAAEFRKAREKARKGWR